MLLCRSWGAFIACSRKKAKSIDAIHNALEFYGVFILISSIARNVEEILDSILTIRKWP